MGRIYRSTGSNAFKEVASPRNGRYIFPVPVNNQESSGIAFLTLCVGRGEIGGKIYKCVCGSMETRGQLQVLLLRGYADPCSLRQGPSLGPRDCQLS